MADTETKPVEETPPETQAEKPTEETPASTTAAEEQQTAEDTAAPAATAAEEAPAATAEGGSEEPKKEEKEAEETGDGAETTEAAAPEPEPEPIEIPSGNGELVLVTGATGYLASHIVKLIADGGEYRVRGTVRSLENNEKLDSLKSLLENAKYPPEFVEADLMKEEGWAEAVKDCEYVIHCASPFPSVQPTDASEVIEPAKNGTLFVLKACSESGTVRRVVVTSSLAAINLGRPVGKEPLTEKDWADVSKTNNFYGQSKTIAEQAAWDFVKELPEENKMELSVVNPGLILGPPLMKMDSTSIELVKKLMHREWSMLPKMSFPVIDVRDVALAHLRAMVIKQAAGNRHIAVNSSYWLKDIANFLSQEFSSKGFNVATTQAPYVLVWFQSHFDQSVKQILPEIGKLYQFDNSRMKNILQIEGRDAKDSVVEMGHTLINFGTVQKVEKSEKKRKLTFRKKKATKEDDEEKKDEPEKIKDNGSTEDTPAPIGEAAEPEQVKVEINGSSEPTTEEAAPAQEAAKPEEVEEVKEEAPAPAAEDADKIETAAAVSSEEEAKEETPDPESSKTKEKKEKPKKEKKKGLFSFSFKSKSKKHVEKKSEEKPAEAAAEGQAAKPEETPATTEDKPAATEEAPAIVVEAPTTTEETPATTEETPATTEETPAIIVEVPATTGEASTIIVATPANAEETPAIIVDVPVAVVETPAATEKPAAEETKGESTPAAEVKSAEGE